MKKIMKFASSIYSEVAILVMVVCAFIFSLDLNWFWSIVVPSILIAISLAFIVMAIIYRRLYKRKDEKKLEPTTYKLEELPFDIKGYLFGKVEIGDRIIVPYRAMLDATWQSTIFNLQERSNTLGAKMLWTDVPPKKGNSEPVYLVQMLKLG